MDLWRPQVQQTFIPTPFPSLHLSPHMLNLNRQLLIYSLPLALCRPPQVTLYLANRVLLRDGRPVLVPMICCQECLARLSWLTHSLKLSSSRSFHPSPNRHLRKLLAYLRVLDQKQLGLETLLCSPHPTQLTMENQFVAGKSTLHLPPPLLLLLRQEECCKTGQTWVLLLHVPLLA